MMYFVAAVCSFSIGFMLGSYLKSLMFNSMDWNMLKWDENVLAYRLANIGSKIHKDDKVFMAVRIPTNNFPREGIKYE